MHKKAIALLMAMGMLFIVTGCDPQDSNGSDDVGNTSNTVTDSSAVDISGQSASEDVAGTDSSATTAVSGTSSDVGTDADADANTDSDTGDTSAYQGEAEESSAPMQVQDNLDVNLNEGEEGAW